VCCGPAQRFSVSKETNCLSERLAGNEQTGGQVGLGEGIYSSKMRGREIGNESKRNDFPNSAERFLLDDRFLGRQMLDIPLAY
jgi:hypothetical protein